MAAAYGGSSGTSLVTEGTGVGSGFAHVAVPLAVDDAFCYRIPETLRGKIVEGCQVVVPLRGRSVRGLVVALQGRPPAGVEAKEIIELVHEFPLLGPHQMRFLLWASQYYLCPLGMVFRCALPPPLWRSGSKRGTRPSLMDDRDPRGASPLSFQNGSIPPPGITSVSLTELGMREAKNPSRRLGHIQEKVLSLLDRHGTIPMVELQGMVPRVRESLKGLVRRGWVQWRVTPGEGKGVGESEAEGVIAPLNPQQDRALETIRGALEEGRFKGFLLWGVTASGKTEVYLRAVERVIELGRQALILVPEISLTHQMVRRFRERFGDRLSVLHSRLSASERYHMWWMIRSGRLPIVIGARSALFAPLSRPGIIIVDEEHDPSYKQQEGFRYNARDGAMMLGKVCDAVVLLGSATPSLESVWNVRRGKTDLLRLPNRVDDRPMPWMEIVDMRMWRSKSKKREVLSGPLIQAMEETLNRGEQVLLFLNRRGYATFLICRACGHIFQCEQCSVTLVYHQSTGRLQCHYCGMWLPAPSLCPECKGADVAELGLGTETLEEAVRSNFPRARVLRMDRDTTTRKHSTAEILRAWRRGDADVLIGTQMVAKGHHVPNVTLVGVVMADVSLNLPDFRSSERTFQLLIQVAGRAGRGQRPGRVIVQTYHPEHPAFSFAAQYDATGFWDTLLASRKQVGYPPFRRLVLFGISGKDPEEVKRAAQILGHCALKETRGRSQIRCLGPAPAPIFKLKGRFRWHLLLKGPSSSQLRATAKGVVVEYGKRFTSKRVHLYVDVDPYNFL